MIGILDGNQSNRKNAWKYYKNIYARKEQQKLTNKTEQSPQSGSHKWAVLKAKAT